MPDTCVAEALRVCQKLGTWLLYDVRDARDLLEVVGYLAYSISDLERMRARTPSKIPERRSELCERLKDAHPAVRAAEALVRLRIAE